MRILQLADFYPPNLGGLEAYVQLIAQELTARGHEVHVACLPGAADPGVTADGDVTVHRVVGWQRVIAASYEDPSRSFHPTFPDPGFAHGLNAILTRLRPHVIHAHSWSSVSALRAAKTTPLVLSLHDYGAFCAKKTNMRDGRECSDPSLSRCLPCATGHYGMLKGIPLALGSLACRPTLVSRVSRFLPVSEAVSTAARQAMGLEQAALSVVPSAIPDVAVIAQNVQPRLPAGPFVLYAGAMSRHKGLDILVEAYERVETEMPLVILGIPGDLSVSGSSRVCVIENADRQTVDEAWRRAQIGVVPSIWGEPAPLVSLEAMRSGTALIASEVGGLPERVEHGRTGLLVPPGDVDALTCALARLAGDNVLREEMGRASRDRFAGFGLAAVADQLEVIYAEVSVR